MGCQVEITPIGIRGIRIIHLSDREIIASFEFRLPVYGSGPLDEIVTFDKPYEFTLIAGKEYGEAEINEWVTAHDNKWNAADFLLDKIVENGALIAVVTLTFWLKSYPLYH